MSEASDTTAEWVYCGERLSKDAKVMHEWRPVDRLVDTEASKWYGPKNIQRSGAIVGAVYVVTVDSKGLVFSSGPHAPHYERTLRVDDDEHGEAVALWKSRHAETQTMVAATAANRKAKKEHDGLGSLTLDQLAHQYRRAGTQPRRNALIAAVIGHMTSTRVNDAVFD